MLNLGALQEAIFCGIIDLIRLVATARGILFLKTKTLKKYRFSVPPPTNRGVLPTIAMERVMNYGFFRFSYDGLCRARMKG